ncbi:MAG: helix-turn-helix domain-containing protein, partial [Moorellaceae bacterium]
IDLEDLPLEIRGGAGKTSGRCPFCEGADRMESKKSDEDFDSIVEKKKELEREAISRALAQTNYNICKAAAILGLGRSTLYRKIKEYNLYRR